MDTVKKMSGGMKALLVLLAAALLLGFSGVGVYNGLVSGDEAVQNAFANIDVQLQRRNDLIPNVIETVKGSAAHESEVIGEITAARANMMSAGTMNEKVDADAQLSLSVGRLIALSESYPDLKANTAYLALIDELSGTENRIAVSRKDYNDTVMGFNRKLRSFPSNLLAGMFGFEKYNAFTASPDAINPPDVGALLKG